MKKLLILYFILGYLILFCEFLIASSREPEQCFQIIYSNFIREPKIGYNSTYRLQFKVLKDAAQVITIFKAPQNIAKKIESESKVLNLSKDHIVTKEWEINLEEIGNYEAFVIVHILDERGYSQSSFVEHLYLQVSNTGTIISKILPDNFYSVFKKTKYRKIQHIFIYGKKLPLLFLVFG
ncbi:MAG: hypothetical protein QME58_14075, partial [Bacteroidota bacterium]|nr:hypothetical protein [Bacteroidota bacterium]